MSNLMIKSDQKTDPRTSKSIEGQQTMDFELEEKAELRESAIQSLQRLYALRFRIIDGFSRTRQLPQADQDKVAEALQMGKRAVKAVKSIMDCKDPAVAVVMAARNEVKNYVYSQSYPYTPESGTRLIRVSAHDIHVDQWLAKQDPPTSPGEATLAQRQRAFEACREESYAQFFKGLDERIRLLDESLEYFNKHEYAGVVENRRKELGPRFDPNDYGDSLSIKIKVWDTSVVPPTYGGAVSPELKARAFKQMQEDMQSVVTDVGNSLVRTLQNRLERICDRMQGGDDGKPKIFKDSLFEGLASDLRYFQEELQVDGLSTEKLDTAMAKVIQAAGSIDPSTLRGRSSRAQNARKDFGDTAEELFNGLNRAMINKPPRKLDLTKFKKKSK